MSVPYPNYFVYDLAYNELGAFFTLGEVEEYLGASRRKISENLDSKRIIWVGCGCRVKTHRIIKS